MQALVLAALGTICGLLIAGWLTPALVALSPEGSDETADHSLPYCMAAGLVDGMVTPLQFKEERVLDKALIPIMDKVKVVANQEFEARFPKFQPSRVTITTNGGEEHSTRVDVPKGDPRDP